MFGQTHEIKVPHQSYHGSNTLKINCVKSLKE